MNIKKIVLFCIFLGVFMSLSSAKTANAMSLQDQIDALIAQVKTLQEQLGATVVEKPEITIVSPNGGEKWVIDNTYEVKFSCIKEISKVYMELYDYDYNSIGKKQMVEGPNEISCIPGIVNTYSWKIRAVILDPGNSFKIKIRTSDDSMSDESDNYFSIIKKTTNPTNLWRWDYCTTSNPCNAGEGDCDIDSHCNTGYCAWNVGEKYGQNKIMDVCEEKSGKSITLTSPNGGEKWTKGNTYNITWKYSGIENEEVWIYLQGKPLDGIANGNTLPLESRTIPVIDGKYTWRIPSIVPLGDGYKIKISSGAKIAGQDLPLYETTVSDTSDNYFSVIKNTIPLWDWNYCTANNPCNGGQGDCDENADCNTGYCAQNVGTKYGQSSTMDVCEEKAEEKSITLTSPNGGEKFRQDGLYNINWKSSGSIHSVKITICMTLESFYSKTISTRCDIGVTTYNDGNHFDWFGKAAALGNYTVKVEDSSNSAIYDESDSYFSIVAKEETPTTCHTSDLWSWNYATLNCKGNAGEGDCDTNGDCNTGYCAQNVGTKYGQNSIMDVCEERPKPESELLIVSSPITNQKIKSPVFVSGKSSFYAAHTRIRIKDSTGKILADTYTTADGWQGKLYPFSKSISYEKPSSQKGVVEIFEESAKDGKDMNKIITPIIFEDYSETTCHASSLWSWDYATLSCKGDVGEGDCDRGSDCNTGYCALNVGTKYGQVSSMDVCEEKTQKSITLIYPDGGEKLVSGQTYNISWTSSGMQKINIGIVGGQVVGPYTIGGYVVSNIDASLGKYSWTISSDYIAGNYWRIFIGELPLENSSQFKVVPGQNVYDASNGYFSIIAKEETTIPDNTCGDGRCSSEETFSTCPKDCGYKVNPYGSDVVSKICVSSKGIKYPTSGDGAANWFVWNGCSKEKFYEVNQGERLFLRTKTDKSMCQYPNFFLYEYENGAWKYKKYFDLADKMDNEEYASYVPTSSRIKIQAYQCFYLDIYAATPIKSVAYQPSITLFHYTETDTLGGSLKFYWTSVASTGVELQISCHSGLTITNALSGDDFLCGDVDRSLLSTGSRYLKFSNTSGAPINVIATATPVVNNLGYPSGSKTIKFTVVAKEETPTTCHISSLWSWDYATLSCKGDAGEGDCDRDSDCNTGYCAKDVGARYGQVSSMDVCEEKQTTTCSSTDWFGSGSENHKKRLSTKGTCTDGAVVYTDKCIDDNMLTDYYCAPLLQDPKSCDKTTYSCKAYGFAGCSNGACQEKKPDLIVQSVEYRNLPPSGTDSYAYFDVTIKNIGEADALLPGGDIRLNSLGIQIYKNSISPANKIAGVVRGKPITLGINSTLAFTNMTTMQDVDLSDVSSIIAEVDVYNKVDESNEGNNALWKDLPTVTRSITVTYPNRGETLFEDNEYTIKWNASNLPNDAKMNIRLYRNVDESIQIVSNLSPTQREYIWKVSTVDGWGYGYEYKPSPFAKILGIKEVKAAGPLGPNYSYKFYVGASWGKSELGTYGSVSDRSDGNINIVQSGSLKAQLVPETPTSETISILQNDVLENVPFTKFQLVALDEPIKIRSIEIVKNGVSDSSFSKIKLFRGDTQIGMDSYLINEKATFYFSDLIIPENSSETITIKADLSPANAGGVSGNAKLCLDEEGYLYGINASGVMSAKNIQTIATSDLCGENMTLSSPVPIAVKSITEQLASISEIISGWFGKLNK